MMNKTTSILWAVVIIILIGVGVYFFTKDTPEITDPTGNQATSTPIGSTNGTETPIVDKTKTIIGTSVEGRDIIAYHYGTGTKEVLFVGGIHGGYEWNTTLVAYDLMDYLKASPSAVPQNVTVTVIPVLNPDGLHKIVGTTTRFAASAVPTAEGATIPGRFNANNVDLNRNFDCDWQANGTWQNKTVSGGSKAFSEPESQAIQNYVTGKRPTAVITWYSAAGGVFASNCHDGVLAETKTLTKLYADASKYRAYEEWNFYEITGDMVNWFAKNNIPAISVLLTTHTDTEWTKNKAGIDAILSYYAR